MSKFKKFLVVCFSFFPLSAMAWGLIGVVAVIAGGSLLGGSIYRSLNPVNMKDAFSFFSTCWTCDIFSRIMLVLSKMLSLTYHSIGKIIIPFAAVLTAIWIAWELFSIYIGNKKTNGNFEVWSISGKFGTHLIKLACVIVLLMAPLPRILTNVLIQPSFGIGLSIVNAVSGIDEKQKFTECVIATAITDSQSIYDDNAVNNKNPETFSPFLRHNLACELANVHKLTAVGMTVGWTMLSMAFNYEYMHKIMFKIPIFPNVPIFLAGLLIFVLFFIATIPIPLYFLQVFVGLTLDLIMLPLMLLSWLFQGWEIFPKGKENIKKMVDDVIANTLGIAMVGVFLVFSTMFISSIFGKSNGLSNLYLALQQNDSKMLMDGLMLESGNTSIITIILMGIFITMFMIMIPKLIKDMFSNISIPDKFYDTTKQDLKTVADVKKTWGKIKGLFEK